MFAINKKGDDKTGYYNILVKNEEPVKDVLISDKSEFGLQEIFELESINSHATNYLLGFHLEEFKQFAKITFNDWRVDNDFSWVLEIELPYLATRFYPCVKFRFIPKLASWKNNYSFDEFRELFTNILLQRFTDLEVSNNSLTYNEFDELIYITYENFDGSNMREVTDKFKNILEVIYLETTELLNKNLVIASFNFPEDIKVSCKQYLEYFATFLKDLGLNVKSSLNEEAGKVLFSITPTDEKQALDKIREALAVYLKLPESPIIFDDSFKSMRLQQQIENLQHSQRMAARELQFGEKLIAAQSDMLHEKNLTISQLQSVNEQQQKIIEKITDSAIMMNSVENKEELEKIYDGLEAGYSKWLYELTGIKANVIKVVKTAVKNTFGKDEKNSVLGLDKE